MKTASALIDCRAESAGKSRFSRHLKPIWTRLLIAWGAIGLLFVGEAALLSVRLDAGALVGRSDISAQLLVVIPSLLQITICVAAVALALLAWRLGNCGQQSLEEAKLAFWPWLPLHLATFAVVYSLSTSVFRPGASPGSAAGTGLLIAMASTALFGLSAIVPPRFWLRLLWSERVMIAAAVLIGVSAWGVGRLARVGWEYSAAPTVWAAGHLLRLLDPEAVANPDSFEVGTSSFRVTIAPACSGYEGMALLMLYMGAFLVFFRHHLRFPQAFILIPLGALLAWLLNLGRIVALVAIGNAISPEIALGGFHSQAGWLAFNAGALGLAYVAYRTPFLSTRTQSTIRQQNPTVAYLAPLLTITAVQMLTETFLNGTPALYPLRVVMSGLVLAACWRVIDWNRRGNVSCLSSRGHGVRWGIFGGITVFTVWVALSFLVPSETAIPNPRDNLFWMPPWAVPIWLVFRIVGSVLVIPLVEEAAFRGYLLRRLVAADFVKVTPRQITWPAIIISSTLFGLLHGQWFAGILAGLVYSAVYCRRGRLADAVIAHATTNGLLTISALASGNWKLWS